MDIRVANSPKEIRVSKYLRKPFGLDRNLAFLISRYLSDKDLINLCESSKGFWSIFYPTLEKHSMSYFLKYVVEGRLDKVKEILNRNKKLVFLQGDITDLTGRIFTGITAFQYATWALDKEMWELLLSYLPEADAYDQLRAFERERLDITRTYGTRLNFEPLLEAYQKYINNYRHWNDSQCEACWCQEIGGAQRQMPAWFVYVFCYVFCEEGDERTWPAESFKRNFAREPEHLRWWFDQEYKGGRLGVTFAVARWTGGVSAVSGGFNMTGPCLATQAAISQGISDRTDELSKLVERLSQARSRSKKIARIK